MIFYFSATGNSKHVAERIAEETGTNAVSIIRYIKEGCGRVDTDDGILGFVTPTYSWVLPSVFDRFLRETEFKVKGEKPYVFFIATCGTTSGFTSSIVKKILKDKGLKPDAVFDIKMPDTWTPIFDLSDKAHNETINKKADEKISSVSALISERKYGSFSATRLPWFLSAPFSIVYSIMRRTKNLRLKDTCMGCGRCADRCPAGVLQMKEGRPEWTEKRCAMCLRCLHSCPVFAIQYGCNTEHHGQYVNPHVSKLD